jgi:hypothetical protein
MKLRWATYYNKVLATEVKSYAEANCISLDEARKILVNMSEPVLEYNVDGYWIPVSEEVIPR